MRHVRAWLHRLGGLFTRSRRERELQAELESHFQLHVDDNVRAGMTPEEARRAAVLKFGPVEAIKEDIRDRASIPLLEILIQDVRYALRRMRRQPGFTALIALTLALGVGANAAMFGLVDVLMFRTPAHVPEPERIVSVDGAGNYVAYQELLERVRSLEPTAYTRYTLSLGQGAEAVPLRAECVTSTYFSVAGSSPWRGRGFMPEDEQLGAPRTVVSGNRMSRGRSGCAEWTHPRPPGIEGRRRALPADRAERDGGAIAAAQRAPLGAGRGGPDPRRRCRAVRHERAELPRRLRLRPRSRHRRLHRLPTLERADAAGDSRDLPDAGGARAPGAARGTDRAERGAGARVRRPRPHIRNTPLTGRSLRRDECAERGLDGLFRDPGAHDAEWPRIYAGGSRRRARDHHQRRAGREAVPW
jgi:hypothetical protein